MDHKFSLGDSVRDVVTGFSGIAVARFEWMNGCVRYEVQPVKLKDGKPLSTETYDQQQLVLVKRAAVKLAPRLTGGPMKTPTLPRTPAR